MRGPDTFATSNSYFQTRRKVHAATCGFRFGVDSGWHTTSGTRGRKRRGWVVCWVTEGGVVVHALGTLLLVAAVRLRVESAMLLRESGDREKVNGSECITRLRVFLCVCVWADGRAATAQYELKNNQTKSACAHDRKGRARAKDDRQALCRPEISSIARDSRGATDGRQCQRCVVRNVSYTRTWLV